MSALSHCGCDISRSLRSAWKLICVSHDTGKAHSQRQITNQASCYYKWTIIWQPVAGHQATNTRLTTITSGCIGHYIACYSWLQLPTNAAVRILGENTAKSKTASVIKRRGENDARLTLRYSRRLPTALQCSRARCPPLRALSVLSRRSGSLRAALPSWNMRPADPGRLFRPFGAEHMHTRPRTRPPPAPTN